jgi:hypothetical protein
MKLLLMNSDIHLSNKSYKVSDIVKSLTQLDAIDIVSFMTSLKLNVPRALRIEVSKALLTSYVEETKDDRETLADEFNYRLRWFSEFSDQQFVNLLDYYKNKNLNQSFTNDLMLHILSYCVDSGVSEAHILELYQLGLNKNNRSFEQIKLYNQTLDPIFFDEPNYIDGLSLDRVRYIFFKGSTLVELREIGLKYGVDVPKRLKKAELLEAVYDGLKERHEYTQNLADELAKKTVIAIQRFAQDNKIKVSSELKKEHVIEYILENAQQTRETYFKPETNPYSFITEDEDIVIKETKPEAVKTVVSNNVIEVVEEVAIIENQEVIEEVAIIENQEVIEEVAIIENQEVIEEVAIIENQEVIEEVAIIENQEVIEEVAIIENQEVIEEVVIIETQETIEEVVIEEKKPEPEKEVLDNEEALESIVEPLDQAHAESEEIEDKTLEDELFTEGLDIKTMPKTFINALQYQGNVNNFKKEYSGNFSNHQEPLVETKTKAPFELRFLFGIVKVIVLIILQTLALILSIAFVLAVIVIVYASVMHFAEPEALIPINEWINSFEFLGKGLLDHISGVFERIGL